VSREQKDTDTPLLKSKPNNSSDKLKFHLTKDGFKIVHNGMKLIQDNNLNTSDDKQKTPVIFSNAHSNLSNPMTSSWLLVPCVKEANIFIIESPDRLRLVSCKESMELYTTGSEEYGYSNIEQIMWMINKIE